jgi:hypothetical protein
MTVSHQKKTLRFIGFTLFFVGSSFGSLSHAASFNDPTWPCVQRKVERLSEGLMWPSPIKPLSEFSADQAQAIKKIADLLALRRYEVADLEPQVAVFARAHDQDPAILGAVFGQTFKTLSTRRTKVIKGIGRFSLGQIALAEAIDATRVAMDQEMTKQTPDYDKVDALEEKLDWDQLIYTDRQQSITYLCETPVLLEKRLFAIAQMLQTVAQD